MILQMRTKYCKKEGGHGWETKPRVAHRWSSWPHKHASLFHKSSSFWWLPFQILYPKIFWRTELASQDVRKFWRLADNLKIFIINIFSPIGIIHCLNVIHQYFRVKYLNKADSSLFCALWYVVVVMGIV